MKKTYWILLTVVVLLGSVPLIGHAQKANRQAWEYKGIIQSRGFSRVEDALDLRRGTDWDGWWEDGKKLPGEVNMMRRLGELGAQGWELVSVIPVSSMLGGPGYGHSTDYAGFTDQEQWIFKRAR